MSGLIGQIGSKSGVLSGSVEFSINTTNYPNATLGLPRKLGSGICRIRFATWIGTFAFLILIWILYKIRNSL